MPIEHKLNPKVTPKQRGHFPDEMDQAENFVEQFNKEYHPNPGTAADWGQYNINVDQFGNGWGVSFVERVFPTSDEAEAVAEFLRHTNNPAIHEAIRADNFVDQYVEEAFEPEEELLDETMELSEEPMEEGLIEEPMMDEAPRDQGMISKVVSVFMGEEPIKISDKARAVLALTYEQYKKDHPQSAMTRGEWERKYGPKTKKKPQKEHQDPSKKEKKYREGWVEIAPTRRTVTRDDGTKRVVEPGEIIGPCRIDSPHRCMPKDVASELSREERVEYYKSTTKKKKKEPSGS